MKKVIFFAILFFLAFALLAQQGAASFLFSANYLPHRYCYLAKPWLVWTNVTMDALIAASYAVIFGCLFWITAKLRRLKALDPTYGSRLPLAPSSWPAASPTSWS